MGAKQFLQNTGIVAYGKIFGIPMGEESHTDLISDDSVITFSGQPYSGRMAFYAIKHTFGGKILLVNIYRTHLDEWSIFWLNRLVVVCVGAGCVVAQLLALGDFTDKHHVTTEVQFFHNLAGKHGIGMRREIEQTVFTALTRNSVRKLIHISSRLHPEVSDSFKRHFFRQNTDIESASLFDHFARQVSFLHRDGKPCRQTGDLHGGIDDTTVVAPVILCRQHKQAVGQIMQRGGVLFWLCVSESNGPTDPSMPFHGAPHREPSHAQCRG